MNEIVNDTPILKAAITQTYFAYRSPVVQLKFTGPVNELVMFSRNVGWHTGLSVPHVKTYDLDRLLDAISFQLY